MNTALKLFFFHLFCVVMKIQTMRLNCGLPAFSNQSFRRYFFILSFFITIRYFIINKSKPFVLQITAKQSTIEIVSSDSDTSPEPKSKVLWKTDDEQCSSSKAMDEYDLMVSGYCRDSGAISMGLQLDLESDSRYLQATKKLQENLAKISPAKNASIPTEGSKVGKFQYKVPKASSMLAALDVPLKKPINFNVTPVKNENDQCKPSSSTPIASSSCFDFKQKQSTVFSNKNPSKVKEKGSNNTNGSTKATFAVSTYMISREGFD